MAGFFSQKPPGPFKVKGGAKIDPRVPVSELNGPALVLAAILGLAGPHCATFPSLFRVPGLALACFAYQKCAKPVLDEQALETSRLLALLVRTSSDSRRARKPAKHGRSALDGRFQVKMGSTLCSELRESLEGWWRLVARASRLSNCLRSEEAARHAPCHFLCVSHVLGLHRSGLGTETSHCKGRNLPLMSREPVAMELGVSP